MKKHDDNRYTVDDVDDAVQSQDVTTPVDLEPVVIQMSPEEALAGASDDDLERELAKRKVRKIDAEIADLKAELSRLEAQRDALTGKPLEPAAVTQAPVTASVNKKCLCVDGCYLCLK